MNENTFDGGVASISIARQIWNLVDGLVIWYLIFEGGKKPPKWIKQRRNVDFRVPSVENTGEKE